jgi:phosphoglucosamine mutase
VFFVCFVVIFFLCSEKVMQRLFGTDGVRGVANLPPMTPEMALRIGRGAAYVSRLGGGRRHRIIIGRDTRHSGAMLESALAAGICSVGVDVLLAGTIPTPAIAYLARSMKTDAGIVISASHNPYRDNGIKIFSRDGYKLPDAQEDAIERLVASAEIENVRPTGEEVGTCSIIKDAPERYIAFCKSTFPPDLSLKGMRLVIDCANGATWRIAPSVFSELGADAMAIHAEPDGFNINDHCGSQHTEDISAKVRQTGADLGLAFDGDGDRLIAVDEKGQELTGDHVLAICGRMYKAKGRLKNNLVVSTVMSNYGFLAALDKLGIGHAASAVGDRHVMEMMREKGAVLGGEPSGHIIFLDRHTTGDGIISALQLLSAACLERQPLSILSEIMRPSPQKTINVDVSRKPPLDSIPEIKQAIRAAESQLGRQGRVLIRYSGTQSLCRVMVEGPTEELTDRLAASLAQVIKKHLS